MTKHDPDLCMEVAQAIGIHCQVYNGVCYLAEEFDTSELTWKLAHSSSGWKSFAPDVDAADAWKVLAWIHKNPSLYIAVTWPALWQVESDDLRLALCKYVARS